MSKLRSLWALLTINLERAYDHIYRYITGTPTLKRSMITPNVYLGGQYRYASLERFKKIGVTAFVNMRTKAIYDMSTITWARSLHLPTPDRAAPSLEDLTKGVHFIDSEIEIGGKVYIHCRFGEGRGPTMAIAYLIHKGMTLNDALAFVKKGRVFVKPTPPQLEQLAKFEKKVKKEKDFAKV